MCVCARARQTALQLTRTTIAGRQTRATSLLDNHATKCSIVVSFIIIRIVSACKRVLALDEHTAQDASACAQQANSRWPKGNWPYNQWPIGLAYECMSGLMAATCGQPRARAQDSITHSRAMAVSVRCNTLARCWIIIQSVVVVVSVNACARPLDQSSTHTRTHAHIHAN